MNYLFVTTGCLRRNHSFVRLRELGRFLSRKGLSIFYLCDNTYFNSSLVNELDYAGVFLLNKRYRIKLLSLLERRRIVKKINPDFVHFLNPFPSNTLTILNFNNLIISDYDELWSERSTGFQRHIFKICESITRQQADIVTVSSRHLQQYFQEKFNRESLYLPYATYIENIEVGPNPFERPTAVYMGNLHHDGDHDILIDAWTILQSQGEAPDLCMIGGGLCLNDVKADIAAKGLTSVNIRGYLPVEDMWTALCHAHVLLFPIRDTIGNRMRCPSKTFAYMQAGRPIVTCRVGEVAEALGDQGIYVEPTAEAFAQKVRDLFYQSLDNIPYDLDRHTWESRAKELMEAIETLEVKS